MAISNMCGSNCGADFLVSMTTGEISFMSPESAANVAFRNRIDEAEDPEEERQKYIRQMELGSAPWDAATVGLIEDVIDPRDTRKYIIDCLEIMHERKNGFVSRKYLQSWPTGF